MAMDVGQLPDLAAVVESLQNVVENIGAKETRNVEAMRQQASAVGLDPDLAEAVFQRLEKKILKNIIAKQVSQEEIIEALLHVVIDPDAGPRKKRKKSWGELRAALRKLGGRLGVTFQEIDEIVDDTGFGFRPDLQDIANKISEWMQRSAG
ncbi:MAG: hypothetical protein V3T05_08545 [Myxococcota bacterium]